MAEVFGYAKITCQSSLNGTVPYVRTANPVYSKDPYRVVIVDSTGARYAELENANVSNVHWELNGDHTLSFSLPSTDPKVIECQVAGREVQLWKSKSLIWWGVIVRMSSKVTTTDIQAVGLAWYFKKRVFGPIPGTNLLTNGDFELGTKNWSAESVGGASLSTFKCCETAGRLTGRSAASAPTVRG